jgi:hypothetical protein
MENGMEVPLKTKNGATIIQRSYYWIFTQKVCQRDICTPVLLIALVIIAKIGNQLKCPSNNEWIKKMWHLQTMNYYSDLKRKKILSFATTLMELEDFVLSKVSQE